MKTRLVIFGALTVATTVASAQPSTVEPIAIAAAQPSEPTSYVQAGVTVGVDNIAGMYGAYTLEGGYRLSGSLWLHGLIADGAGAGVDEQVFANYFFQARVGVESRACAVRGIVCGMIGVDAAYRHEMLMADGDNNRADDLVLVPRLGLDVGSRHVRVRPALEAQVGAQGFEGLGLELAVAVQF